LESGALKVDRPWLELPAPLVTRGLIENSEICEYLPKVMDTLWTATEKYCGAKKCTGKGKLMFFCEGCRDFFHLACIGDIRIAPEQGNDFYMCPLHIAYCW